MRKQRIDIMLHILTEKVELDFRHAELRITMTFEPAKLSKEERESRRLAEGVESATMPLMVETYNYGDEEAGDQVTRSAQRSRLHEVRTLTISS
jgi:hypothetical protein